MPTSPPSIEAVKRFYDAFGKRQDWQAFYEDAAVKRMVEAADFGEARAVFELGCGTGRVAQKLLDGELPFDARYTAVDVSDTMVSLAEQRLARFGERVSLRASDGTTNPQIEPSSFDRFLSTYVLDLMSEAQIAAALDEAHRLLSPDGRLCLVSLSHGQSAWGRVLEAAWMAAWRRSPVMLGGCRPIELLELLPSARWQVLEHDKVSAFGLCSEVLIASPS